MFSIRTPVQVERTRTFEAIVGMTGEALADPRAIERLGVLGVDLAQMNEQAFLPNLKRGRLTLPREYRESDRVAIVPVLETEYRKELKMSLEMFEPTPQRRRKMEQYAAEHPGSLFSSTEYFIASCQAGLLEREGRYTPRLWRNSPVHTYVTRTDSPHEDALYFSSRPIVFIGTHAAVTMTPGMVAHEYVHAHDSEARERPPQDQRHDEAYKELRGYFAQFVMFETAGIPKTEQTMSVHMERLRRSFGMSHPPQSPDEVIPAGLVEQVCRSVSLPGNTAVK